MTALNVYGRWPTDYSEPPDQQSTKSEMMIFVKTPDGETIHTELVERAVNDPGGRPDEPWADFRHRCSVRQQELRSPNND